MADIELGPIATRILYEDDQIRIWDQRLAPGEATAPHHHELDYVLVDVDGTSVHVEPVPGHAGHVSEPTDLPVEPGKSFLVPRGSTELASNQSDTPYRSVLIEFKRER